MVRIRLGLLVVLPVWACSCDKDVESEPASSGSTDNSETRSTNAAVSSTVSTQPTVATGETGASTRDDASSDAMSVDGACARNDGPDASENTGPDETGVSTREPLDGGGSSSMNSLDANAGTDPSDGSAVEDARPVVGSCDAPLALHCGDRWDHSTVGNGQTNALAAYACTPRALSGRETIYDLTTEKSCEVEVRLTNIDVDLNLLALVSCEPFSAGKCSALPLDIQDTESVTFSSPATTSTVVVVDGYDEAEGSYTIEVDCSCED